MTVARELADFVEQTTFRDLPAVAVERAKMVLVRELACVALGSEIASARILRVLAEECGGAPEASLWFASVPILPLADVARANAAMRQAADAA